MGRGGVRAYQVKGSTVRSKFDFVHETFGGSARASLEERFANRDLLPILVSGWYDFDLYIEVLEAIAEAHFDGDLKALEAIGAYSAETSLRTVYAAFVRQAGFVEFLRGMSRLHHMFYNAGEIAVEVDVGDRVATILHRDKPRVAKADLYIAAGFYRKAAEVHEGSGGATCDFVQDDDGAHFTVRW